MLQGAGTDPAMLAGVHQALAADGAFEGEVTNYRKDGQAYLIGWAIAAICDDAGAVAGWLSVQHDITRDLRRAAARVRTAA